VRSGRGRILSVTLSRRGTWIVAALKVAASRPQQPGVAEPSSLVGVDVGMRRLATVATPEQVIAVVDNPKALERRLTELRGLHRQRSRRRSGSSRYRETAKKLTRLHAQVAAVRQHAIHNLTAELAKTHGVIVVEGLDAAGMLQQKGLPGARRRRRGLFDAALGKRGGNSATSAPGTGAHWWRPTASFPPPRRAMSVGTSRTLAGRSTGAARPARRSTSATTTPPSTSPARRAWAQLAPR